MRNLNSLAFGSDRAGGANGQLEFVIALRDAGICC
jgi:hypothetical protein